MTKVIDWLTKQEDKNQLQRYAACVQYDGRSFFGWQRLKSGLPSVQQTVEKAISQVANESIEVVCAGRTDKGVHASGQIIHFTTRAKRSERSWLLGTNSNLCDQVALSWVTTISQDFHARFSANWRRYRYLILNCATRPAHLPYGVTWFYHPLDVKAMQKASYYLLGEHDFTSYRAVQCQAKHAARKIMSIKVSRQNQLIIIDIKANAFLHHMVRNIAGVLLAIGQKKQPAIWAEQVLQAKDRTCAGITAPAAGLYMVEVGYDSKYNIPKVPVGPWFLQEDST